MPRSAASRCRSPTVEMQAIGLVTDRFSRGRRRGRARSSGPGSVRSARAPLSPRRRRARSIPPWRWSWRWRRFCFLRGGDARFTRTLRSRKADGRAGDPFAQHGGVRRAGPEAHEAPRRRPASGRRRAACGRVDRALRDERKGRVRRGGGPARVHAPVRRSVDWARRGVAPNARDARGLRPPGRPAPRRSLPAARAPVGRAAALEGRRRGRTGRAARLRSRRRFALADRVLATAEVAGWAFEIMARHHFATPGLMSVLNQARLRSGVLAPAQFAFLKLVDRPLWYALHALGFESDALVSHPHPSFRVEAIGAGAHWAAERAAGVPIPTAEFGSAHRRDPTQGGVTRPRFPVRAARPHGCHGATRAPGRRGEGDVGLGIRQHGSRGPRGRPAKASDRYPASFRGWRRVRSRPRRDRAGGPRGLPRGAARGCSSSA